MKVLLVRTTPPGALKQAFMSPLHGHPLGIMQVAAGIRARRPSDTVRVVDAAVQMNVPEDVGRFLGEFDPDVVGFGAASLEEPIVKEMVGETRRRSPDAFVMVGGPMVTSSPERTMAIEGVDLGVQLEGEIVVTDILDALEDGRPPRGIPGTVWLNGGTCSAPPRPFIEDLDSLPAMDWDDLDLDLYSRVNTFNDLPLLAGRYAALITSRGCPYQCIFCHGTMGKKVRAWSTSRLVDEIEGLVRDHGVGEFHINDDIFNYRKGRIEEFCSELDRRDLRISFSFPNGLRGDRLTRAEIEAMASSGCYSISLAVESAHPRVQRMIRKKLDVEAVFEAAEWAARAGIFTRGYSMLGFPGETREEMEYTIDRMRESSFHTVFVQPVIPYPGTQLFDMAVETGFDHENEFSYAYDLRYGGTINASTLTDEEFGDFLIHATRSIYEHPARREKLKEFYRRHPRKDHPLFRTQGQWKQALG